MRKQYHFWPAEQGFDAWDVDRLIELSAGLPVEVVAVDTIAEVNTVYWFDGGDELPTVRKIVEHARLINQVDSSFPIVLGPGRRVMDGMHRIARALLEGQSEIDAVRFPVLQLRTDAAWSGSAANPVKKPGAVRTVAGRRRVPAQRHRAPRTG